MTLHSLLGISLCFGLSVQFAGAQSQGPWYYKDVSAFPRVVRFGSDVLELTRAFVRDNSEPGVFGDGDLSLYVCRGGPCANCDDYYCSQVSRHSPFPIETREGCDVLDGNGYDFSALLKIQLVGPRYSGVEDGGGLEGAQKWEWSDEEGVLYSGFGLVGGVTPAEFPAGTLIGFAVVEGDDAPGDTDDLLHCSTASRGEFYSGIGGQCGPEVALADARPGHAALWARLCYNWPPLHDTVFLADPRYEARFGGEGGHRFADVGSDVKGDLVLRGYKAKCGGPSLEDNRLQSIQPIFGRLDRFGDLGDEVVGFAHGSIGGTSEVECRLPGHVLVGLSLRAGDNIDRIEAAQFRRWEAGGLVGGDVLGPATCQCGGPGGFPNLNIRADGAPGRAPIGFWGGTGDHVDSLGFISADASPCDSYGEARDRTPPLGQILSPMNGACYGPSSVPVTVLDDYSDACSMAVRRDYTPAPGPNYSTHGDQLVVLGVHDEASNTSTSVVTFTIDLASPKVIIEKPTPNQLISGQTIPFRVLFQSTDEDCATGGVIHELVSLSGCPAFDGNTYGNRDGILGDETLIFGKETLCRISATCGIRMLQHPTLRVEASDCGGNYGASEVQLRGSLQLKPGVCD